MLSWNGRLRIKVHIFGKIYILGHGNEINRFASGHFSNVMRLFFIIYSQRASDMIYRNLRAWSQVYTCDCKWLRLRARPMGILTRNFNFPHLHLPFLIPLHDITGRTASCVAICLKYHVIITNATQSCHNCTLYRQSSNTSQILKLVRYYAVIISRYGILPCKLGGKWCSLLWQIRQNSSKISMDRLIKVDDKMLIHKIHVSYISSLDRNWYVV